MGSKFRYTTLQPKQIRLFKLDLSGPDELLSGIIVVFNHPCHMSFELTAKNVGRIFTTWNDTRFTEREGEDFGYDALSYAWGNLSLTYPLRLSATGKSYQNGILDSDGHIEYQGVLAIHENLRLLLIQLRRMRYNRFIWIDAICINQTDKAEKSKQIPLMRDIYQDAKQVWIWLGEATPVEEGALTIMLNLTAALQKALSDAHYLNPDVPDSFEDYGLPTPSHPVWSALGQLMSRTWFKRLWTLQEAVLPPASIILCGSKKISWQTLDSFADTMTRSRLANWTIFRDVGISSAELDGYESVQMTRECRFAMENLKWGVPIHILLNITRRKMVTNPADMVFGMLALVAPGVQRLITVDVSLPIVDVYLGLAKYYIRNEPDECLLNQTSSVLKLPNLPSWCPNFGSPKETESLGSKFYGGVIIASEQWLSSFTAGFKTSGGKWEKPRIKNWQWQFAKNTFHRRHPMQGISDTTDPRQLAVHANGKALQATGIMIDNVIEIVDWNRGLGVGAGKWNSVANLRKTRQWEQACLALAQNTLRDPNQIPEAYWRTLIANMTGFQGNVTRVGWDQHHKYNREADYSSFVSFINKTLELDAEIPFLPNVNETTRAFASEFIRITRRRRFFATKNGRIGIGPSDTQVGDQVCVILFCPTPYVLRKDPEAYRLVGDTYMHGLMYSEALDMVDQGLLKETQFLIH